MTNRSEQPISRHQRNYLASVSAFIAWLKNPISENGPANFYQVMTNVLGPEIHNVVERMRNHPDGKRLLVDKPDLGAVLADMDTLRNTPQGSLGRTYVEFMGSDEIIPGYIIAGLIYKDGHMKRLYNWDDDAKFLLTRGGNTHDLTHILSGYGTDMVGEFLVILFSLAAAGVPRGVLLPFALTAAMSLLPVFRPQVSLRNWLSVTADAVRRGAEVYRRNGSLINLYFEEMLDKPVSQLRRELHIPAHKDSTYVNDEGWLVSAGWMQGRIGKDLMQGRGKLDQTLANMNRKRALVESGIPLPTVMQADDDAVLVALGLLDDHRTSSEIAAVLA